jgi:hypothetical protein
VNWNSTRSCLLMMMTKMNKSGVWNAHVIMIFAQNVSLKVISCMKFYHGWASVFDWNIYALNCCVFFSHDSNMTLISSDDNFSSDFCFGFWILNCSAFFWIYCEFSNDNVSALNYFLMISCV